MAFSESSPPADLGFCHPALDRAAHRREDGSFLDQAFSSGGGATYALIGETVVLRQAEPVSALFRPGDLPFPEHQRERVFLGLEDGGARFATLYEAAAVEALAAAGLALVGLRQCALDGMLPPGELAALAEGKALLHWHRTHRFCAACGAASTMTQAGWRRDCPACKALHFPRTDPVVIMLAVKGDNCLMGRQKQFVPGMYSCLAGFCEPGETIEDAVRREVLEEAGVRVGRVRYLGSQPWPFPASLMIGCLAEALDEQLTIDPSELEDARWFSRDEVRQILARAHPDGIGAPGRFAIARAIVTSWATGGEGF